MSVLSQLVEAAARVYARCAPTERGGYRVARLVRRARRRDRWLGVFTTPWDGSFELDLATYPDCCMAYGLYELDTARLIRGLLRPGDHFIDIGANIGYFTVMAARRVGEGGRVDAFEPDPENRARLIANLQRNGVESRVRVHDVALSDREGRAVIHRYAGGAMNHGCSTLHPVPGEAGQMADVRTARLDDVRPGVTPRLIKMDVEGAEPEVVAGMRGLLRGETPPAVIGEFNPTQAGHAGQAPGTWVRAALEAQPAYGVWWIGSWLCRVEASDAELSRLRQGNLLLRPVGGRRIFR